MCDLKKIMISSDMINGTKSKIVSSVDEIIQECSKNVGVILELPWESDISGTYLDKIQVTITKVWNHRVYFINPIKVTVPLLPYEIRIEHKKGLPRLLEKDKTESVSVLYLKELEKQGKIRGIVTDN
ncbi:MAG: hypothetical protein U0457_18145 [Candidatus Sericytochromatia bacterium]